MTLGPMGFSQRGGMGFSISAPHPSVLPRGCGLGWATSTLRNLGAGPGAVSEEEGPHAHPSFFKRCSMGMLSWGRG